MPTGMTMFNRTPQKKAGGKGRDGDGRSYSRPLHCAMMYTPRRFGVREAVMQHRTLCRCQTRAGRRGTRGLSMGVFNSRNART